MVRLRGGLDAWKAAGHAVEAVVAPKPAAAASLGALLTEAELSHLAPPLSGMSLEELTKALVVGRTHLLDVLKEAGLKLPDRQKLAKALARNAAAGSASEPAEAALAPAPTEGSVYAVD